MSRCHIVGNHMSRLNYCVYNQGMLRSRSAEMSRNSTERIIMNFISWCGGSGTQFLTYSCLYLLQSLKQFFINVSYHILVATLTPMALFKKTEPSELDWLQVYDTLMKNCLNDWSQSMAVENLNSSIFNLRWNM